MLNFLQIPSLERDFIRDQRTCRKMQMAGVDRNYSKKLEKRKQKECRKKCFSGSSELFHEKKNEALQDPLDIQSDETSKKNVVAVGCDETITKTEHKSGIIVRLEQHIKAPVHWIICKRTAVASFNSALRWQYNTA
ncbi:unnamed protein product [Psylliodes chrysocephalus]|uniref:Uncharacterized protein n=1 Tax=Psylliodes chrysocephalus TaxID=3402493 RepID=A0A9P0GC94_9CUCU|nr:unnamed protein product [Psylliodes chrysocephala]